MEEEVLKILRNNLDGLGSLPREMTAREITEMVMMFIEWTHFEDEEEAITEIIPFKK